MLERQLDRRAGRFNRILGIGMGVLLVGGLGWSLARWFLPESAEPAPAWRAP